jgi:acyl-homoserine lactone acylase PvdQ
MASFGDTHIDCFCSYLYLFDTEKDSADSRRLASSWRSCSTGQSGDPLSKFYADNIRKWARVEYKTLFFDNESIERNSWKQLWLVPESSVN